jgi:NitT/TauT family transport system permease protein
MERGGKAFEEHVIMQPIYKYRYLLVALSLFAFVGLWWGLWRAVDDPRVFPSPIDAVYGFGLIATNQRGIGSLFLTSLGTTMFSVFAGFALAAVVGVPVGILMGRYLVIDYTLDPQVNIWYSLPAVAFIPLVMRFLGTTVQATLSIAFLISLFSVVINVYTGVKNISKTVVETSMSFGSSGRQLLTKIIIPESLPNMMLGLRLALTRSLEGVVVAELIFTAVGIGGMIFDATDKLELGLVVALILVISFVSIGLNEGMKYLNRRVVFWKESAAMARR